MLFCLAFSAIATRAFFVVLDLVGGLVTAFLAFPLTVILPTLAFVYVGRLNNTVSEEGALMQLGVLIQLLLILALPSFALYLALGFPVVFWLLVSSRQRPRQVSERVSRGAS